MKKIFVLFSIFIISPVFGEMISDFSNLCGNQGYHRIYAIPKYFTCQSGYFLPANAINCIACPDEYVCAGGTYTFNQTRAQGIVMPNKTYSFANEHNTCSSNINGHRLYAIPKTFTCAAGKFLPANAINCHDCPDGYTCAGGTYTFNQTRAQGIIANNPYITSNTHNTCSANLGHNIHGSFTPNTISITYYNLGEEYTTGSCVYDTTFDLPPNPPARPGYTFMGWKVINN